MNQNHLQQYAASTPFYLGLKPGINVYICATVSHASTAALIEEAMKAASAGEVRTRIIDTKTSSMEEITREAAAFSDWAAQTGAGFVRLVGREGPEFYEGLTEQEKLLLRTKSSVVGDLSKLLMSGARERVLLAAPTYAWAKDVFPELSPDEGVEALWRDIFDVCFISSAHPQADFLAFDEVLEERRTWIQSLQIASLRFEGPGLDFTVGLTTRAKWLGGRKFTPEGNPFYANVPIGEVFTTPDWRTAEGTVRITMPFFLTGTRIEELSLTFEAGRLVSYAPENPAVAALLAADAGARRVGEIALVSMDSPLAKMGRVYSEVLFDEKARCHLAIGEAYTSTITGAVTEQEREELGINSSSIHYDFMISDGNTRVTATSLDGKKTVVIDNGLWAS